MTRATVAALLLCTSALLAFPGPALAGSKSSGVREQEIDDESDSAPFMIVVEHGNGRRCGGSLVSLRTALTSAWCVRGPHGGNPRELWALSPGVPSVGRPASRRVSRVALVAGADSDSPSPHLQPAWIGAALDIAVLELEAPFGGGARSRPILMATRPEDCAVGTLCHVGQVRGRSPRLRILDATLVPGEVCGAAAAGWSGLRDSALCLAGPMLCEMDRGAGVVCDGKLCGVLSRSARAVGGTTSQNKSLSTTKDKETYNTTCGDTHVALGVSRMRRFLHCAHTLRACGRGGECSQQCSERQLMVLDARDAEPIRAELDEGGGGGGEPTTKELALITTEPTTTTTEHRQPDRTTLILTSTSTTIAEYIPMFKTSMDTSPTRTPAPSTLASAMTAQASSSRPSFEFEPNRADFRDAPARTSRVYLKAGEYGDNALDYGDAEESAMGGAPAASTTTTDATLPSEPAAYTSLTVSPGSSLPGTTMSKYSVPTHTAMTFSSTTPKTTKSSSTDKERSHVRVAAKRVADNETQVMRSHNSAAVYHSTLMSFAFVLII